MTSENQLPPECRKRFQVVKLLAQGGFGNLYLAEQTGVGRPVVVKVLRPELLSNDEQRNRFLGEARAAAALAHPHIVFLIDHSSDGDLPWIAYEYLPGQDVAQLAEGKPLPWSKALLLLGQMAGALACAHGKGILHRDIKAQNILQAAPDHFKLTDFGIAKWLNEDVVRTGTGVLIGTPDFIAPEQVLGQPATSASDLYALGLTFFGLVSGRPAFEAANSLEILTSRLKQDVPHLREVCTAVPEPVAEICRRLTMREPADRYESAEALGEEVRAVSAQLAVESVRARRRTSGTVQVRQTGRIPARPSKTVPVVEKRRSVWGVALAGVLLIGGVGAIFAGLRGTPAGGAGGAPASPLAVSIKPQLDEIELDLRRVEQRAGDQNRAWENNTGLEMFVPSDRKSKPVFAQMAQLEFAILGELDLLAKRLDKLSCPIDGPDGVRWSFLSSLTHLHRYVSWGRREQLLQQAVVADRSDHGDALGGDEGFELVFGEGGCTYLKSLSGPVCAALRSMVSSNPAHLLDLGRFVGLLHLLPSATHLGQEHPRLKVAIRKLGSDMVRAIDARDPFGLNLRAYVEALWQYLSYNSGRQAQKELDRFYKSVSASLRGMAVAAPAMGPTCTRLDREMKVFILGSKARHASRK